MEHDAWFFVGVFVFIFLIWIATGGPLHSISFTGPTLALPGELGGGTYLSLPRSPFTIGGGDVSLPGSSSGGNSARGTNSDIPSFVGGISFGEASPYRGIVRMNHYISSAGSADPRNEYLEISVSGSANIPISLSGWTLRSDASGSSSVIPKGTETPASGTINAIQDIVLTAGDRATIVSGRSPIGASFRENKCIGFFSSFQKFYPPLPQNCPMPSDELIASYGTGYIRDTSCIDYVNTLSRCQVALTPSINVSNTCQSFVVKYLNYNGCVEAHRNDADFKGDTWRIYLGRTNSMWRTKHEIVKLIDTNGKTVDAFSY